MQSSTPTASSRINLSQETRKATEAKPLILVVEDHEDTRFLLCYLMERWGFRVVQALDGAEAVFVSQRTLPDLILMDTALPRVDGLMATRAIRKIATLRKVPIVFVSGHASPEARAAALAIGGNEYFVKPINLRDLEITVKKQLARKANCESRFSDFESELRIDDCGIADLNCES